MKHANAEILRALADGKKVQYRHTCPDNGGTHYVLCPDNGGTHYGLWPDNGGTHYGLWQDFDGKNLEACLNLLAPDKLQWRIAPKTIKIGEHEVPEPCREPPKRGTNYWTFTPQLGVARTSWLGSDRDNLALEGGFVHLTKEAAEAHYEAIKSMSAKT